MFIPYNVDVPMRRWPFANWGLIAVTVGIAFYVWTVAPLDGLDFLIRILKNDPADPLFYWLLWRGEQFHALAIIGHIFSHADILHLLGNMLFLFVFGNAVNARLGHIQYILLYLAAGIVAALAWLAVGSGACCLGASGAIMGIVGMFLVLYPRNNVSVFYIFYRVGAVQLSAYWVIAAYIAFDIWGLVQDSALGGPHSGGGVAYISHVAGALFGAGLIATLVYLGIIKPEPNEENLLQVWKIKTKGQPDETNPYANTRGPVAPALPRSARTAASTAPALQKYLVVGKDRTSGFATHFTINAPSEAHARAQADKDDIVVTQVTPIL